MPLMLVKKKLVSPSNFNCIQHNFPASYTSSISLGIGEPKASNCSDGTDTGTGTGVTDASAGTLVSEKGNDNNSHEAAKPNGKLGTIHSVALSSTASGGISTIVPTSSNNGPLAISAFTFSSPPAPAASFASQISNSIDNLASSPSTISSAANTSTSAAATSSPVFSTAVPYLR